MHSNRKIIPIQPFIDAQKKEEKELNTLRKEVDDWLFSMMDIFAIDLDADNKSPEHGK